MDTEQGFAGMLAADESSRISGTGGGGHVLRSTDSGLTWSDLGQQFSQLYFYTMASLGGGVVLAGTLGAAGTGKLLRSIDYGATWSDVGWAFGASNVVRYLAGSCVLAGHIAGGGNLARSLI